MNTAWNTLRTVLAVGFALLAATGPLESQSIKDGTGGLEINIQPGN